MQSPLIITEQSNKEIQPISQQWQIAQLYLQLGRLNQSLQFAYSLVQQDAAQKQQYLQHQSQTIRIGAEFAEEIGDHAKAAYYWEQLTRQAPRDSEAWYGLGIAKANLQDFQGAANAFQQVLRLSPGHQKARSYLQEVQGCL
jgi:tetratricopeptide (TPR) repeat protein